MPDVYDGKIWEKKFWGRKERMMGWWMIREVMMTLGRWDDHGGVMNREEADQDVAGKVSKEVEINTKGNKNQSKMPRQWKTELCYNSCFDRSKLHWFNMLKIWCTTNRATDSTTCCNNSTTCCKLRMSNASIQLRPDPHLHNTCKSAIHSFLYCQQMSRRIRRYIWLKHITR